MAGKVSANSRTWPGSPRALGRPLASSGDLSRQDRYRDRLRREGRADPYHSPQHGGTIIANRSGATIHIVRTASLSAEDQCPQRLQSGQGRAVGDQADGSKASQIPEPSATIHSNSRPCARWSAPPRRRNKSLARWGTLSRARLHAHFLCLSLILWIIMDPAQGIKSDMA